MNLFDGTLIDLIALSTRDAQNNWDLQLGVVLMAYRSSVHASTGFTPFSLMFGSEMRVPLEIMFGGRPNQPRTHVEAIDRLRDTLQSSYELARTRMQTSHKRQKDYYDRNTTGNRYKIGDKEWLFAPALKKSECAKFHIAWTGPWTVLNQLSDVTYRIKDNTGKMKVVHFDRLKLYLEPIPQPEKDISDSSEESEMAFLKTF